MHRASYFFLTLFIYLLAAANTYSQEYPTLHYTVEDGLPGNTVYQVYRDSKGFLWIATDKGIARYNGIQFEKFTVFDGLPDNEIYLFKEDHFGRLWIGAANGKLCFYKNGTFHTEENTPFLKLPFKKPQITCVSVEFDSSVTFSFYEPAILVNIYKESLAFYNLKKLPKVDSINIYHKRKISKDKFKVYGRYANAVMDTVYNVEFVKDHMPDLFLKATASQDQEYIMDSNFVFSLSNQVLHKFTKGFYQKNFILSIYSDQKNLFFATRNGLFIGDTLPVLKGEISSITQDKTGNYWVGSLTSGIFCLRKDFLTTSIVSNVYSDKILYCRSLLNQVFYTTSGNDLYSLNKDKPIKIFDYGKYIQKNYVPANDAAYLLDTGYTFYSFYNNDNIVVDNILAKNLTVNRYTNPFFPFHGVKAMMNDGKNIYLKTRNNVINVDYKKLRNGDIVRYRYLLDSATEERIYNMVKDKDNSIWYSKLNSMFKIQDRQSEIQPQFNDLALKAFDFLGAQMVGYTFDNKLLLISNLSGPVKIDSIPSPNCVWNKLYKLNDSMMLISTNSFHCLLRLHTQNAEKFSLSVIEDPFVPLNIEAFCSNDSTCYFFKNGSVTTMSLKSLLKRQDPPKLFFFALRTSKRDYSGRNEIEIPFSESKYLSISFSTLSFAGKSVSCQYSVSKTGEEIWRAVKGEEINLVNPGYGDYLIKVRAKTISSDYSAPIIITLHILKPFWATWWFILLCIAAAVVLVVITVYYRLQYVFRKKEQKHESEVKFLKLEYKALNAMMNPHFIFNALNNMQGLINRNEKLAANKYLSIFATLVRQNMHNISLELIPLDKEMDMVANYLKLEKLRFKDHLNYAINIDENVDTSEVMVAPLLVQPLVENAIKHGLFPRRSADSFVGIDVYEQDSCLVIAVKDNGIGMAAAKERSGKKHQSYGLENIRKRIAQLAVIQNKQISLHISDIKDDAGKLQWTIVSISISLP